MTSSGEVGHVVPKKVGSGSHTHTHPSDGKVIYIYGVAAV